MKNARKQVWLLAMTMVLVLAAGVATAEDKKADKQPAPPAADKGGGLEDAGTPAQKDAAKQGEAEGEQQSAPSTQPVTTKPPSSLFSGSFIWILLGAMLLMILFSSRSKKKQKAKRNEMLSTLKKGDRVITIGGIVGSIVEAREEEIVLKIDDNTRMKFARWAIRNAGDEVKDEKKKAENQQ